MKFLALLSLLLIVFIVVVVMTPVRAFNAVVPKDGGVDRVAAGIAFGGNPRLRLDGYRPSGSARPLPVIVFCYGGSWATGDRRAYEFAGRSLAAAGFLTIVYDYRLVPAIRFPGFLEDTAKAIAWARSNAREYGGDPRRIYLVGHSAGAYNVVMATLDQHYLAAAGVPGDTVKGVVALAGPYDFLPFDVKSTIDAFGRWPDAKATQPVTYVRADAPPMLLMTGTADTTVYPRNSQELAKRLRATGASVEHRSYEGLSHAGILLTLSRPFRGWAPVRADLLEFLKHLDAGSDLTRE